MRAIVIKQYSGPEVLALEQRPEPESKPGHVIVDVKAFGLNRAETYMRSGAWGDVAEITGIECVGIVKSDPDGKYAPGQKVSALMGGMGRLINGSYAEVTRIAATNVVPLFSNLPWEDLVRKSRHLARPDPGRPWRNIGPGPGRHQYRIGNGRPRHRDDQERQRSGPSAGGAWSKAGS